MHKEYTVSFDGHRYKKKPEGKEKGRISCNLSPATLTYDFLAKRLANDGCTFCPAVYDGSRKNENFVEQQLFVVDIDHDATYTQMKERADSCELQVLFSYKTFSWTPESDKFRIVFALDQKIYDPNTAKIITALFMRIFNECDKSCKDLARMFFGSNHGLYDMAPEANEISLTQLILSFNSYMHRQYGHAHYTREIDKFYTSIDENFVVQLNGKVPVIEHDSEGSPVIKTVPKTASIKKTDYQVKKKGKRRQTEKIDFDVLEKSCRLFRDFKSGEAYYYYPLMLHLATNLVNMEKGKKEFLRIVDSPQNEDKPAYHERDWAAILDTFIDMQYNPQSCDKCSHCEECLHYKNMIRTVKPGFCGIKPIERKDYCTIEEAEKSLEENFYLAVNSNLPGVKLLKAQTGLGKTSTFLNFLKRTKDSYILAVPTHELAKEIYQKANRMDIHNVRIVPQPILSDNLQEEIDHIYNIGAGEIALEMLRDISDQLPYGSNDRENVENFFSELDAALNYDGHIIMTHERLLCFNRNSDIFKTHKVIIDEDILRSVCATVTVDSEDIEKALESDSFGPGSQNRLKSILSGEKYQRYSSSAGTTIDADMVTELSNISSNIIELLYARVLVKDAGQVTFIKRQSLPCDSAVIMSATASADLYKYLMNTEVTEYSCKQAHYKGKILQYTNSSYSRSALANKDSPELLKFVHSVVGDDEVITFKCSEEEFGTAYHYGNIEGLNCLEGKNISVIGLPNSHENVYKLYGMLMGVDPYKQKMQNTKVAYNGCEFYLNTFSDIRLRKVQLWMISSALEQAIGRARLLRNDCTVTVFARFPVDQAKVM